MHNDESASNKRQKMVSTAAWLPEFINPASHPFFSLQTSSPQQPRARAHLACSSTSKCSPFFLYYTYTDEEGIYTFGKCMNDWVEKDGLSDENVSELVETMLNELNEELDESVDMYEDKDNGEDQKDVFQDLLFEEVKEMKQNNKDVTRVFFKSQARQFQLEDELEIQKDKLKWADYQAAEVERLVEVIAAMPGPLRHEYTVAEEMASETMHKMTALRECYMEVIAEIEREMGVGIELEKAVDRQIWHSD